MFLYKGTIGWPKDHVRTCCRFEDKRALEVEFHLFTPRVPTAGSDVNSVSRSLPLPSPCCSTETRSLGRNKKLGDLLFLPLLLIQSNNAHLTSEFDVQFVDFVNRKFSPFPNWSLIDWWCSSSVHFTTFLLKIPSMGRGERKGIDKMQICFEETKDNVNNEFGWYKFRNLRGKRVQRWKKSCRLIEITIKHRS